MGKKKICKGFEKGYNCTNLPERDDLCKKCLGKRFQNDVKKLFKQIENIDYPEIEKPIIGSECDIFVIKTELGKIRVKYCIECKNYKGNVGKNAISQFCLDYYPMRIANLVDIGLIISPHGFSKSAKERANEFKVILLTINELNDIVDEKKFKEKILITELRTMVESEEVPAGG